MNKDLMFSSKTDLWSTPQDLFEKYDAIYHFETDVCALPENAKCKRFFTPEMDGLKQEWTGVCWCNPPYGRQIGKWVEKAVKSFATVVMLLPARTDTKWFHEWCLPYGKIEFLRGRLKFGGCDNPAPFPSMIVIFEVDVFIEKGINSDNIKHGKWEKAKQYGTYECSCCGYFDTDCSDYYGSHSVKEQKYCPECGAKMDL